MRQRASFGTTPKFLLLLFVQLTQILVPLTTLAIPVGVRQPLASTLDSNRQHYGTSRVNVTMESSDQSATMASPFDADASNLGASDAASFHDVTTAAESDDAPTEDHAMTCAAALLHMTQDSLSDSTRFNAIEYVERNSKRQKLPDVLDEQQFPASMNLFRHDYARGRCDPPVPRRDSSNLPSKPSRLSKIGLPSPSHDSVQETAVYCLSAIRTLPTIAQLHHGDPSSRPRRPSMMNARTRALAVSKIDIAEALSALTDDTVDTHQPAEVTRTKRRLHRLPPIRTVAQVIREWTKGDDVVGQLPLSQWKPSRIAKYPSKIRASFELRKVIAAEHAMLTQQGFIRVYGSLMANMKFLLPVLLRNSARRYNLLSTLPMSLDDLLRLWEEGDPATATPPFKDLKPPEDASDVLLQAELDRFVIMVAYDALGDEAFRAHYGDMEHDLVGLVERLNVGMYDSIWINHVSI